MQLADAPDKLRDAVQLMVGKGVEAGIRVSVIARPTRDEAIRAARALVASLNEREGASRGESEFIRKTDSVSFKAAYELGDTEWLTPYLWTGAIRAQGSTAIALVGAAEEVADAFLDYKRIGVSQFILSGWPKLDEMVNFGRLVLPIVREKERNCNA